MKKYFLCMVALLSLAIVACESDDTAPAPTVRPTFDLIDAQPDVTSAVVAANIESKGEVPISEVGFSYQEAGGEYVDVVCTNFKDGLARQTLTGLKPDAVVVVATVRALKNHGGVAKAALNDENLQALEAGLPNLLQHVENITNVYKLPCVVAINRFPTDTEAELKLVEDKCRELGVNVALSEVWAKGGEGGLVLADEVVRLCEQGDEAGRSADTFEFAYDGELSLREKIEAIAKRVYRADGVDFEAMAAK